MVLTAMGCVRPGVFLGVTQQAAQLHSSTASRAGRFGWHRRGRMQAAALGVCGSGGPAGLLDRLQPSCQRRCPPNSRATPPSGHGSCRCWRQSRRALEAAGQRGAAVALLAAAITAGVVGIQLVSEIDRASARPLWRSIAPIRARVHRDLHRSLRYGLNYYSLAPLPDCRTEPRGWRLRKPGRAPRLVNAMAVPAGFPGCPLIFSFLAYCQDEMKIGFVS